MSHSTIGSAPEFDSGGWWFKSIWDKINKENSMKLYKSINYGDRFLLDKSNRRYKCKRYFKNYWESSWLKANNTHISAIERMEFIRECDEADLFLEFL